MSDGDGAEQVPNQTDEQNDFPDEGSMVAVSGTGNVTQNNSNPDLQSENIDGETAVTFGGIKETIVNGLLGNLGNSDGNQNQTANEDGWNPVVDSEQMDTKTRNDEFQEDINYEIENKQIVEDGKENDVGKDAQTMFTKEQGQNETNENDNNEHYNGDGDDLTNENGSENGKVEEGSQLNYEENPEEKYGKNEHKEEEGQNENDENQNAEEDKQEDEPEEGMTINDTVKKPAPEVTLINPADLPPLETTPEIDSQCQVMMRRYKRCGKLPEPDERPMLLQWINRQKVNCVAKGKYMEAHEYQELAKKLTADDVASETVAELDKKIGILEDQIIEIDKELKREKTKTERALKNKESEGKEQRRILKQQHIIELQKFEDQWNDPNFLKRFGKPSPALLQLSTIEHSLVTTRMFDRAEQVKKEVSEMEKMESAQAQERAIREMEKARIKLDQKQQTDVETLEKTHQIGLGAIRTDGDRTQTTLTARKERLQAQIDDLKALRAKRPLPPLKKPMTKATARSTNPATVTPRTQTRFALCKATFVGPKVQVKPLGSVTSRRKHPLRATM